MYITQPVRRETKIECPKYPTPCEQPVHIYFNLLGAIFGLTCLVLFLIRLKSFPNIRSPKKKIISNILAVASLSFLILFILYFVKVEYKPAAFGCPTNGAFVSGRLWPEPFRPLYSPRQ